MTSPSSLIAAKLKEGAPSEPPPGFLYKTNLLLSDAVPLAISTPPPLLKFWLTYVYTAPLDTGSLEFAVTWLDTSMFTPVSCKKDTSLAILLRFNCIIFAFSVIIDIDTIIFSSSITIYTTFNIIYFFKNV